MKYKVIAMLTKGNRVGITTEALNYFVAFITTEGFSSKPTVETQFGYF